jgi:hypothetical protein
LEKYLFLPRKPLPQAKEMRYISRRIELLIGTGHTPKTIAHTFHRGAPLENVSCIVDYIACACELIPAFASFI